ncbi:M50 family metallopeptidase [Catellatospora chokoriensis]|uniref:Zinc metalloprotease n=1 Tax=Catellatospora chokoriensis TaxID=310353 RepID=A0A8J3K6L7_9ACTN|nr:M50 family metallopeptidase [Catellatospora chokoriensis]GIF94126.1 peptidase M50 [Catellatospora chokoriensis]
MTDSTSKSASRGERKSGFQVGRIFGFPLRLSVSWVIMSVLITVWYGDRLGDVLHLDGAARYLAGLGFVACLLLSVLLHELGHALTARHYGIGVKGITLDLLGGYTEFDHDSPRPGVELATALAGPAVSALLGIGSVIAALLLPDGTIADQIAFQLALCNIIVAIYNALPGWPLDGGRALRAVVWGIKGDRDAGLLVAGWSGRVVAVATVLISVWLYFTGWYQLVGVLFGLFVAFSIWQGAAGAVMTARVRSRYPLVDPVRLARPLFTVPTGTSLAEATRRATEAGHAAPVLGVADSDGRLIALVVPEAAAAVPEQRRPWITVETLARGIDGVATIPSGARGADVIKLLRGDPATPYLVVDGENVVGVLTVMDVVQVLDPAALKAAN